MKPCEPQPPGGGIAAVIVNDVIAVLLDRFIIRKPSHASRLDP